LLTENLPELLVDDVDHLLFLLAFIAVLAQTVWDLASQLIELIVIKSFILDKFKLRRHLGVLQDGQMTQ
jgi:hypothetical protein